MNERQKRRSWNIFMAVFPFVITFLLYLNAALDPYDDIKRNILMGSALLYLVFFYVRKPCEAYIPFFGFTTSFLIFLLLLESPHLPSTPLFDMKQDLFENYQVWRHRRLIQFRFLPAAMLCSSIPLVCVRIYRHFAKKTVE